MLLTKRRRTVRKKVPFRVYLLIIILALSGVSCTAAAEPTSTPTNTPIPTYTPAPTRTPTPVPVICGDLYDEVVDPITRRWDDATDIAFGTSRINLAGPIGTLQEVRRDAEDLDVPECAIGTHELLIEAMQGYIDGFLAFMADDPESTVDRIFNQASDDLDSWGESYAELFNTPIE